jgi:restriction system protein
MGVPDFQSFFKPLLEFAADGEEHSIREARQVIARSMNLSEADLSELLPSGTQTKSDNRVAWARSYFVQAKVIESTRRGYFRITDRGRELLAKRHSRIDIRILDQCPEFVEFHSPSRDNDSQASRDIAPTQTETPEETLQKAYQNIRNELRAELLSRVKSNSPRFFELLVVDLMIAMGYGGSKVDAGKALGQTGDEGVDGMIKEDRLGLDVIYLQAKRWEGTVGRPEIHRFVGALHGKRARKGVFITSGRFSEDAVEYVNNIDPKVILIDGRVLSDLMIDFDLGTTTAANYELKKIDSDYFGEE